MFRIENNIDKMRRKLSDVGQKQLPYAMAVSLTETAKQAKEAEEHELDRVFDRPTPFTKRGIYVVAARKNRPVAQVGMKQLQARYLEKQVGGGVRRPKGKAIVMPVGQRLNKYGNMPKGALRRMLAKPNTFSGKIKGVGGVWQRAAKSRRDQSPKLLVAYRSVAQYRARFNFQSVAMRTAQRQFPSNFIREFRRAIQTSR